MKKIKIQSMVLCFILLDMGIFAQEMEIGEFLGLEGIRLCWQSWRPAEKPKAAVILMHGGNNYSDMDLFRTFAGELNDAGYCVYSFDQRGFGRSEGIRMHMGKWENIRGDYAAFLHFGSSGFLVKNRGMR
jgi:alpha-beta hydrolase superfamily lysophospholipase